MQARTEYGVLPQDHAKRTDAILQRVIGRIEAGCGQSEVHSALEDLMETDNAILYSGNMEHASFCLNLALII